MKLDKELTRKNQKIKKLKTNISNANKKNKVAIQKLPSKFLSKLKSKSMGWFNVWSWPAELIDDIRQWFIVRAALKEQETIEKIANFRYEIRQDNIGRLYTVINIPEELTPYDKQDMVWPWVVEQLREVDDLLIERQLSDLLFPDIKRIPNASAYLVILASSTESLSLSKFLYWIWNLSFSAGFIYVVNQIIYNSFNFSFIQYLINLF